MPNLQRVNLMLDPQQREALERLAQQKKRSVSELVREYITAGLREENAPQQERLQSLENARMLKQHILKRRKGQPLSDISQVIEQMREERGHELLGH
jgi:predicted CopG family antitoxin